MKRKNITAFSFAIFLLLAPTTVLAVEYTIPEVTIDAQLTEDGTVEVVEQHTYEFEDDFEGLLREIGTKPDTSVEQFEAFENNRELEVEQEDDLFRIYRAGDDETVTVEMHYQITGAVEKFEDGAEFYWGFFDERNESDYGNMTIIVHPPAPAEDVEFLGYEEAQDTASLMVDGAVEFNMGEVPEGRNGDIRVIYDAELFPAVEEQAGTVRDELADDRQQQEEDAAAFAANQQTARGIGNVVLPVGAALLALLLGWAWFRSRRDKQQAAVDDSRFFVPKQKMSIPATIYYVKSVFLSPNATAAALMELVRKGHVKQVTEDIFELIDRNTEYTHEAALIELLFDHVGDGTSFDVGELENYTKDEDHAETYNELISQWTKGIADEVKGKHLYRKHSKIRWSSAVIALVFGAAAGYFGWYELYPLLAVSIFIAVAFLAFAVFYHPRTVEGLIIKKEWQQLTSAMEDLPSEQWHQLTHDEKLRAYAYALGVENKNLDKKGAAFSLAETASDSVATGSFVMNPIFLTTIFVAASSNSTAHASGGSSMPAGGGGVGGSGGGSGAF
ncbi:DUF2207 domain-containing protein [Planococcus salinus]|nr:DUF2207 domain-containing protein [Planococcus salinus]